MMKYIIVLLLWMRLLTAQELVVVANKDFSESNLSVTIIRDIFLDKHRFVHNKKVLVMNFKADNSLRLCFEKKILKKSKRSLERYWRKAYYLGKRPPKVVSSMEMLFSYLNNVNPAIGYSDANSTKGQDFKILFRVVCD